jgi:hypothetical protein
MKFAEIYYLLTCKGLTLSDMISLDELSELYDTAQLDGFRGETASILNAILHQDIGSEDNQQVSLDGAAQSIATLTIGNLYDVVFSPNVCNEQYNLGLQAFTDTQFLNDQEPNAMVYSRMISSGSYNCVNGFARNANHFDVLNNRDVEQALIQFLPNGGVPSALPAAKH